MSQLQIDPEFRDKIPPLTEAEFQQLRENILADGEVYEPIITWNDTIVDGHNRWRVICENWDLLKDHYRVKAMTFTDKWDALDWMCKKQLGRRNLTDEQRTVLIGKMYEARKKSVGGTGANQHTKEQMDHYLNVAAHYSNLCDKTSLVVFSVNRFSDWCVHQASLYNQVFCVTAERLRY